MDTFKISNGLFSYETSAIKRVFSNYTFFIIEYVRSISIAVKFINIYDA